MRNSVISVVLAVCVAALVGTYGCGSKPYNYHPGNEIPEGPGLFSEDDGEFTIYKSKPTPTRDGGGAAAAAAAEGAAAAAEAEPDSQAAANQEFQEFQAWKKEAAEFEAFQEWKESAEGSVEYQEFLEWKRWQEYKQWRNQQ